MATKEETESINMELQTCAEAEFCLIYKPAPQ
jgi:hypothetical protein